MVVYKIENGGIVSLKKVTWYFIALTQKVQRSLCLSIGPQE